MLLSENNLVILLACISPAPPEQADLKCRMAQKAPIWQQTGKENKQEETLR